MTIYLKIILFLFLICFKSQAFENPKVKINNFFKNTKLLLVSFQILQIKQILKPKLKSKDLVMNME